MTKLCTVNVKYEDVKKLNIYKISDSEYSIEAIGKFSVDFNHATFTKEKLHKILFEKIYDKKLGKTVGPFISDKNKITTLAKLRLEL